MVLAYLDRPAGLALNQSVRVTFTIGYMTPELLLNAEEA